MAEEQDDTAAKCIHGSEEQSLGRYDWWMGSPGEEGDSASIQLWWVPAAAGPAWVNRDTKNSWQLLWQDEPWICTAVSDPVSSVKTPPMAGQSCSNNANNTAAKFQVFPKFILSILMESPGFEPVSAVFYRLCISINPFSSAFPVQGCREGAGAYPSCQRVKGAPLQG